MKSKVFKYAVLFFTLISPFLASAQIKISGEIRPRSEFRNGFKTPILESQDPAFFTEQRTRLNLDYENEKFFAKISVQDVRIWGAVDQVYKTDPSLFNLHEGYAGYKFSSSSAIRVGRMELDYDNARFLGNLGWAQQSRSHDLALFTYSGKSLKFHLGAAFNQDANTPEFKKVVSTYYSGVNNYKAMQFAWLHKDWKNVSSSLLILNNGVQTGTSDDSSTKFSQTFGTFNTLKGKKLGGTVEAYYQTGDNLAAYLLAGSIQYKGIKDLPLTLGVDYLSGTKAGDSKNTSFNPMYGTNHKFYGFMDYFYVGNAHGNVGLTDIYLNTKVKLSSKSALLVFAHQFSAAVEVPDMSKNLGTEIDLVFNKNIAPAVNLKAGYSQMFASDTMYAIKGKTPQDKGNCWGWVMLTFSPVFFSSK